MTPTDARTELIVAIATGAATAPTVLALFGWTSWPLLLLAVPAGALVGLVAAVLSLACGHRKRTVRGRDRGGHVSLLPNDREAA